MWPPLSETHGAAPLPPLPAPVLPPLRRIPLPASPATASRLTPPPATRHQHNPSASALAQSLPPRRPPPHYGCKLAVTPPPLDRPIQLTHAQIGSCPRAALVRQPEVLTPRECPFVGLSHYGQTTFHRTPAPTPLTPPPHPTTTAPTRLTRARFPRAGLTSIEIKITSRSDLRRDRVEIVEIRASCRAGGVTVQARAAFIRTPSHTTHTTPLPSHPRHPQHTTVGVMNNQAALPTVHDGLP